ncbi:MAG TPA: alkaline phosphatase family protein [Streptosporangiaceae bacterium]|jgi:phospholipase C|nr:alkaline phosphatase family protein [Streptosporangiaceae bacterium]
MFDERWAAQERREIRRRTGQEPAVEPGSRPRPDQPIGTDLLPQIRHIVVLMMENHFYDNYLGTLAGRGEGLAPGPDGAPAASNPRLDGQPVPAHHLLSTIQVDRVPTQSWNVSHLQDDGGRNDGFVTSIERFVPGADPTVPMGYWTEQDLPFYHGLARTFPLADHWFCSYARPDHVTSTVYDHTSILKLVEQKWNLPAPSLPWRG